MCALPVVVQIVANITCGSARGVVVGEAFGSPRVPRLGHLDWKEVAMGIAICSPGSKIDVELRRCLQRGAGTRRRVTAVAHGSRRHQGRQALRRATKRGDVRGEVFLRLVFWSVSGAEPTWLSALGGRIPSSIDVHEGAHLRAEPIATTGTARWRGEALNRLTSELPFERGERASGRVNSRPSP